MLDLKNRECELGGDNMTQNRRSHSRMNRREEPDKIAKKRKKTNRMYDYSLLCIVLLLVAFGLVMIYSTSYYSAIMDKKDSMYYLKRQGLLACAGLFAMVLVSKINYHCLLKSILRTKLHIPDLLMGFALILQVYVLIFGQEFNGAKRWISLGPLGTFQPSDYSKWALIIYLAYKIYISPRVLDTLWGFVKLSVLAVLSIVLVGVENVSTAIVMCLILGGMCFIASKKKSYYFGILLVGLAIGAAVIFFGEGFRMKRFAIWLNVEEHPDGFQILQGLYAVASGGFFGKGLGQSMQKLGYVPEAQNDMIFSIICEELGMFGAFCIMLLFIGLLWRILKIAFNSNDLFGGMLCTGVFIHVAAQVLLNIAVVTNSIPSTGVALPFISYGGTAEAMMLVEMGIVLSVSNQIQFE